ncbi:MAG: thymidine phosphorylase [Rhodospirillales bacterium]|jgi:thymidine phosphorylase|nr:thymidine phosphorylase [Rhodospirillales bacterium]
MLPQEVIRKKRDGETLSTDEIAFIVRGITDNSISEGQAAAFAMAVFLRGMVRDETVSLTREMMNSGSVLNWATSRLNGPVLDKHSTGGVGDKVSLLLAPMIAACGGFVPMISGRGLGHTGGTLDKLDTVPGYDTAPTLATFRKVVASAGCAIIGQTEDLAPADRRLYGIRDVTATVESIPLITASILSKKLAAGLTGLVMDVKTGSGAFASSMEMAVDLAQSIVSVANGAGLATSALITDMNQVLGRDAGNALEVMECIQYLTDERRDPALHEATMALSAELLMLGGIAKDTTEARRRLQKSLDSGAACERFARMVADLGGPAGLMERPGDYLPAVSTVRPVFADHPGVVISMDTRAVGVAIVELGGGRRRADDIIDPAVGLSDVCAIGEEVDAGHPLAFVHARDKASFDRAADSLKSAISVGNEAPSSSPVVIQRIGRADT